MNDDIRLLRQYAESGSEAAFGELVRGKVNLVYSAAMRQAGGDTHLAEEITQARVMVTNESGSGATVPFTDDMAAQVQGMPPPRSPAPSSNSRPSNRPPRPSSKRCWATSRWS
jgi:hypothetical protein